MPERTKAEEAVVYLMHRIMRDPTLAYYFDPITESMQLMIEAYIEITGRISVRNEVRAIPTEAPRCPECDHCRGRDD